MGRKLHSIHVIGGDIERVSHCLATCQITNENRHENFIAKTRKILSAYQERTATFYLLQTDNVTSIYSSYFENHFDMTEFRSWFVGLKQTVFFLDYFDDFFCKIDIFQKYKFLTPLILQEKSHRITQQSCFHIEEIRTLFPISESDLNVDFDFLEEYLKYFSFLFKIPFDLSLLDVIGNPKAESLSFYI